MKFLPKHLVAAATLVAVIHSTPVMAADGQEQATAAQKVLVTDFRGRPPFKRHFVSASEPAEFARFEEQKVSREAGDRFWVVEARRRPPFKRRLVSWDEVADVARFEETDASSDKKRIRRGPPGKLTSRRLNR